MRISKLLRFIICFSLVTTLLPLNSSLAGTLTYGSDISPEYDQPAAIVFSDLPQNFWAYDAIQEMARLQIIKGYPDGLFRPNRIVTRAEFAKIMVSALGIPPAPTNTKFYADVPANYWAAPYINAIKSYMTGYKLADGRYAFKPQDPVQREDVAVALVKYKGYDVRLADESILDAMFSDVDAISTGLKKYVALAIENLLMSGYPDGTFRGQRILTRAEAATLLFRVSKLGNDNKVVIEEPQQPQLPQQPQTPPPAPQQPQQPPSQPPTSGMSVVKGTIYIDGMSNSDVAGKGYKIRNQIFTDANLTNRVAAGTEDTVFTPYEYSFGIYKQGLYYMLVFLDMDVDGYLDSNEPRTIKQVNLDYNKPIENLVLTLSLNETVPESNTTYITGTISVEGMTSFDVVDKNYKIRDEYYTDPELTISAAAGLTDLYKLPQKYDWAIYRTGTYYLLVYLDKDGDLRLDPDEPKTIQQVVSNGHLNLDLYLQ